jgi:hypothetical protein
MTHSTFTERKLPPKSKVLPAGTFLILRTDCSSGGKSGRFVLCLTEAGESTAPGVVVVAGPGAAYPVGRINERWDLKQFEPFVGTIHVGYDQEDEE